MGFFGFLRSGEFTVKSAQSYDPDACLMFQDVAVDSHIEPSLVRVHLKQSKTDPFRHGIDIYLGRTNTDLCPVTAILSYTAVRKAAPGPFFWFQDGSLLTREKLVAAIRQVLSEEGMDPSLYSGQFQGGCCYISSTSWPRRCND